jgi:hypothetical protein
LFQVDEVLFWKITKSYAVAEAEPATATPMTRAATDSEFAHLWTP